jgi:hypothetical protein
MPAKYAHTNLIARDWRALAAFYERVFGCTPVPPERDLSGEALERGSGVAGASLQGVHLRLPGCGADGPTLEILLITSSPSGSRRANRPGFGTSRLPSHGLPRGRSRLPAESHGALHYSRRKSQRDLDLRPGSRRELRNCKPGRLESHEASPPLRFGPDVSFSFAGAKKSCGERGRRKCWSG